MGNIIIFILTKNKDQRVNFCERKRCDDNLKLNSSNKHLLIKFKKKKKRN